MGKNASKTNVKAIYGAVMLFLLFFSSIARINPGVQTPHAPPNYKKNKLEVI
ncbi:MAG: hypothetical protein GF353_28615 [Candidatus Lokiarchaeota archaeon]|nr:hypothetical protein [Candidatus Lokiarchaeota archaeon]MBD3353966.1 hypothetical protein [Candidatus Lokiarchaeota archaeon]